MEKERRLKRVFVAEDILIEWIKGKFPNKKVKTNIPDDAIIVNMYVETEYVDNELRIMIYSKSFPELVKGSIVPLLHMEITEDEKE